MLPRLLLMSLGPLLFWPVFFLTQWLRGRQEPTSSGEWLWALAWLAALPLVALIIWQHFGGTLPERMEPTAIKRWIYLGYAVGVLALGSLAALLTLIGLIARLALPLDAHILPGPAYLAGALAGRVPGLGH